MKYAVALSGGVDSTAAGLLLKRADVELIGLTMETDPVEERELSGAGERSVIATKAAQAADFLGISHRVIDLSDEFSRRVKGPFIREYARGRTPNPCVYCNCWIKFGILLKKAEELGCHKMATGHYAKTVRIGDKFALEEANDPAYDQSYFLYGIPPKRLVNVEFPLGGLQKQQVQRMMLSEGFAGAEGPSSQDICFAHLSKGYREYLKSAGSEGFKEGDIIAPDGKVLGRHKGIAYYTVGQRKGLGLSVPEPFYVTALDRENNRVFAGPRRSAMKRSIIVSEINWFFPPRSAEEIFLGVKIRYNSSKAPASVRCLADGKANVIFEQPQFAPAPGQAAVFYEKGRVLGGGVIDQVLD